MTARRWWLQDGTTVSTPGDTFRQPEPATYTNGILVTTLDAWIEHLETDRRHHDNAAKQKKRREKTLAPRARKNPQQ